MKNKWICSIHLHSGIEISSARGFVCWTEFSIYVKASIKSSHSWQKKRVYTFERCSCWAGYKSSNIFISTSNGISEHKFIIEQMDENLLSIRHFSHERFVKNQKKLPTTSRKIISVLCTTSAWFCTFLLCIFTNLIWWRDKNRTATKMNFAIKCSGKYVLI